MAKVATILIIEDHATEARFFEQALTEAGYEVVGMAPSSEEAMRLAGIRSPDLVLADIAIEGSMDGIEVSRIISDRTGAGIVYLTGNSDLHLLERAKVTEPFGYLVKPIEFRELISTVAMALFKRDAQLKLSASEEQFRILYEDAPLAYLCLDQSLRIIKSNKALSHLIGYSPEEILGGRLRDFIPEETVSALERFFQSPADAVDERFRLEAEVWRKDGSGLVLELHARRARGGTDGSIVLHCILSDITEKRKAAIALMRSEEFLRQANDELERRVKERTGALLQANRKLEEEIEVRKRVEVSLRESEERFRAIVNSSSDCMFIKDRSGRYAMVNPAMAETLGREIEDILGKRSEDIYPQEAAKHIREVDLRVLDGEHIEEEHTRRIGSIDVTFLDHRFPLVAGGQIEGICGVSLNITDRRLRASVQLPDDEDVMSETMRAALQDALRAAKTDAIVLLTGESGSGKDWIAKYIHAHSSRSSGSFFSLNCAALPPELAESELFGHEPGAFTGTRRRKKGLLELAEGGTLLLNEIGEMDLRLQAKLLTFLDNKTFTKVGGEKEIKINARLLAATNRDLGKEVQRGRFRHDLYFRLNVLSVHVPPLRERPEDIPVLARKLLEGIAAELHLPLVPGIDEEAMEELRAYHWPGNVRELRNVLERSVLRSRGGPIDLKGLNLGPVPRGRTGRVFQVPEGKGLNEAMHELKSWMLEDALKQCRGNRSQAARMLGISRLVVINYLKESGKV